MPIVRYEVAVNASPERCFDLMRSVDLHVDSSQPIATRAENGRIRGLSKLGDATTWSSRFFGWRFYMTTRIEKYSRPEAFDDEKIAGLLKEFRHHYTFQPTSDGGCLMADELHVRAPWGVVGRAIDALYLERRMTQLVRHRLDAVKRVAESDAWSQYVLPGEPT